MGDVLGSLGVVVSSLCIEYGRPHLGKYRFLADPICSLLVVVIVLSSTIPLLRATTHILLNKTPKGVDTASIESSIKRIPGVLDVHCMHFWSLTSKNSVGSLHVVLSSQVNEREACQSIKAILHEGGVHRTTIQVEVVDTVIIQGQYYGCTDQICRKPECVTATCCSGKGTELNV